MAEPEGELGGTQAGGEKQGASPCGRWECLRHAICSTPGGCRGLNGRDGTTGSHHEQDGNSDDEEAAIPVTAPPLVTLRGVHKVFANQVTALEGPRPRHSGWRVPLPAWAIGLRQIDGFAVAGGPHGADAWRDRLACELPGTRLRVSGTDADAVVRRVHQCMAAVAPCRSVEREGSAADRGGARAGRARLGSPKPIRASYPAA